MRVTPFDIENPYCPTASCITHDAQQAPHETAQQLQQLWLACGTSAPGPLTTEATSLPSGATFGR